MADRSGQTQARRDLERGTSSAIPVLMAADEAATVETLKAYRDIITRLVARHDGRVVNAPGDALFAEFPERGRGGPGRDPEVQQSVEGHNIELEADRRMQFRIGVNLGDVIEEADGTIYGDGVNIAARVEALAEPGRICVTRNVYNQVKNKVGVAFELLGEHRVKNIAEPMTVYRVLLGRGAQAIAHQCDANGFSYATDGRGRGGDGADDCRGRAGLERVLLRCRCLTSRPSRCCPSTT